MGAELAERNIVVGGLGREPDPWAGMIRAWLAEVQLRTGSKRTPVEYGHYLEHFAARLAHYDRSLASATAADIHAFAYAALPDARRGGSPGSVPGPSSVSVRLAAIRSLYEFAKRLGAIQANPADLVRRPRLPEPTPKGLSPVQVRQLLAATPENETGIRDRAIILTAVLTGLRREELIGLTKGSITFGSDETPMCEIRTKGGKIWRRELPEPAWVAIGVYLEAAGRPFAELAVDDRLFPISSQTLYENLRRYGARIGVADLTVHSLRHTAAKLRRQSGASLEDVQAVLGHSNIATTARYLARLEGVKDTGWRAAAALLDEPS